MSVEILTCPPIADNEGESLNLLTATQVVDLVRTYQKIALPHGDQVFPWLHGLSPAVCPQTVYFQHRAAGKYAIPELLMPIKVGDSPIQIKGSISPSDVLQRDGKKLLGEFLCGDPEAGVNLRNFKFQAAKCIAHATILVYSFDEPGQVLSVVELVRAALSSVQPHRKVLMYTGSAADIDEVDPDILTRQERLIYSPFETPVYTQWDINFRDYERLEILHMSKATPVELGDTVLYIGNGMDPASCDWETLIECFPYADMPTISRCDHYIRHANNSDEFTRTVIEFPASDTVDPSSLSARDVVMMLNVCKAVHARSVEGFSLAVSPEGYRGNTLFVVLYSMFCTGKSMAEVLTHLHRDSRRPILCSDNDVEIFRTLEALFCEFCPSSELGKQSQGAISAPTVASAFGRLTAKMYETPSDAFVKFSGSLPSRILDYMYLGALKHAQYPEFLVQLGISRILSVGEKLPWLNYVEGKIHYKDPYPGIEEVLYLPNILDDGVDSLLPVLDESLEFLNNSHCDAARTLVHCRVGVSRSAAICIAEVMRRRDWSLPRAYLFVRVRRLNLIIQPNLRFLYDLYTVEEHMNVAKGRPFLRTMEWPLMCREIARINS